MTVACTCLAKLEWRHGVGRGVLVVRDMGINRAEFVESNSHGEPRRWTQGAAESLRELQARIAGDLHAPPYDLLHGARPADRTRGGGSMLE